VDDLLTAYGEAIEALFARTTGGIKPGLERTEQLLVRLGSPQKRLSAIHVAGTNGKGSVVATCDALLRARGLKVGRYTSPHLIDFRERITINGSPITERDVVEFLEQWVPFGEQIGATFFELTTAMAFDWLARNEVDVAVIETGLGGRLDSTNVLEPLVTTVTSIGLDHTDLLGNTREAIAREKAGIFKRGAPAVIGETDPSIRNLLAGIAGDVGSSEVVVLDDRYDIDDIELTERGTAFTLADSRGEKRIVTPLTGAYQARNTATAIATLATLGDRYSPPPDITRALRDVFLPGRFHRHGKYIFDVAHNPDGARTVAQSMIALDAPRPRVAVVAVLADKDWQGIVRELAPAVDRFVFTNAPSAPADRRWNAADAHALATSGGIDSTLETNLDAALKLAGKESGTVLVTGSFHTVGDVMSRLQVSPFAA
jgi:dihydrofolate synthase/folylpolyglutamate synthase